MPEGFSWKDKVIVFQTHVYEARVTANDPYGKWQVGVTVDNVRARSLADLGSADDIAQRILKIEKNKDRAPQGATGQAFPSSF